MEETMATKRTSQSPHVSLACVLKRTAYQGKPPQAKSASGPPLWDMLPEPRISRPPVVGCPLARNVWALCGGGLQKCANNCCDFFLLFRALVEKLYIVELERWAVITWAIWNARNKYYLEKVQTHPKEILSGALGFLQEYQTFMAAQLHSWATGVASWSLGWFGNAMFEACIRLSFFPCFRTA